MFVTRAKQSDTSASVYKESTGAFGDGAPVPVPTVGKPQPTLARHKTVGRKKK